MSNHKCQFAIVIAFAFSVFTVPALANIRPVDGPAGNEPGSGLEKEIEEALRQLEKLSGQNPSARSPRAGLTPQVKAQLLKALGDTGIGPAPFGLLDLPRVNVVGQAQKKQTPQQQAQQRQQLLAQQQRQQQQAQQKQRQQQQAQLLRQQQQQRQKKR